MLPFADRTTFTGVYRNEARSEMCFLAAGIFSVQVFRGCGRDTSVLTKRTGILKPLQIHSTCRAIP